MKFRARRVLVLDRDDAVLAESEQLDRELRRMVRRLETFTDHLLATAADLADGSPGGAQ